MLGTTFKYLPFILCDFIRHPNISKHKETIKPTTNIRIMETKQIKSIDVPIVSKLFI